MTKRTIFSLLLLSVCCLSCEIDNYEEPEAFFTGRVVYNGEPIHVANDEVRFQLFQSGYTLNGPFDVWMAPDGSFSSLLKPGDFKLKFVDGQGPFQAKMVNEQQQDTIFVEFNGSKEMEIEVNPYYMIRNPEININNNTVTANLSIEQILEGEDARDVERIQLYLNNKIAITSNSDYWIAASEEADLSNLNNLNLNVAIPDGYLRSYIFARIGVKIVGVEDLIFSPVEKLNL